MRITRKTVEYAGFADPSTPDEIKIEILGLRNAIRQAEERISRYEQALEMAMLLGRQSTEAAQRDVQGTGVQAAEAAEENQNSPPLVR
jgi:hypothetical protein